MSSFSFVLTALLAGLGSSCSDEAANPAPAPSAPATGATAGTDPIDSAQPVLSSSKAEADDADVPPPDAVEPVVEPVVAPGRHALWTKILERHVSEDGWVDYARLRSAAGDLDAYLRQIASTRLGDLKTRNERMAFWINAYNVVCIKTLIDHELPGDVPHAVFFGANIFTETTYRVAGKKRPLDEIEHEILRAKFKDNRVHAALVCGASSCPRLRNEAYEGATLAAQLDGEARRWVQSGRDLRGRRKNRLDRRAKTFYASKIFDWFDEDFGGDDAGVLRFIRRFASDEDRAFMTKNRIRLRYLDYDWSLNKKK